MAFIPKEHEKYDLLPNARKNGWEVFEYDSELLNKLQEEGCDISFPYYPASYNEYYSKIDDCIKRFPKMQNMLEEYKQRLIQMNDKHKWGIVKYNGETNSSFTKGRFYYVPIYVKENETIVSGVIDDEEFTAYKGWSFLDKPIKKDELKNITFTTPAFEIIIDPDGVIANSDIFNQ